MKEIEILVELHSTFEDAENVLSRFQFVNKQDTTDIYYYDPLRNSLKPNDNLEINQCLRLRTKNNKNCITYKIDHFADTGKWLYSDEYETDVNDLETLKRIFDCLGLKELLVLHNVKRIYKYKDYEISLEDVDNLGYFLEVEYCTSDDVDILKIKEEIWNFIKSLNLNVSTEVAMGKPEMLLKKIGFNDK